MRDLFRSGNHNPRNLYRVNPDGTETHLGCVFDEAFGPIVVAALNATVSEVVDGGWTCAGCGAHGKTADWPAHMVTCAPVSTQDTHGGDIQVYESSAASGPHLWLKASVPSDLNNPRSERVEAAMHLTVENACVLAEQIRVLARDHYQETSDAEVVASIRESHGLLGAVLATQALEAEPTLDSANAGPRHPAGSPGVHFQPGPQMAGSTDDGTPAVPVQAEPRCCVGPLTDGTHPLNCTQRCQDCGGDPNGPRACKCPVEQTPAGQDGAS